MTAGHIDGLVESSGGDKSVLLLLPCSCMTAAASVQYVGKTLGQVHYAAGTVCQVHYGTGAL